MSERQREQEGINIGKKSDLNMLSSLSSAHFTTLAHIYCIFRLPFSSGSLNHFIKSVLPKTRGEYVYKLERI